MDVKTAFLNRELDKERDLYRLTHWLYHQIEWAQSVPSQTIHLWSQAIVKAVVLEAPRLNHLFRFWDDWGGPLCVHKRSKKSILILSLYVDDILLAGNEMSFIVTTREWLSSQFEIKDMGEANYVLGIKIVRDCSDKLLYLSQQTYIAKVLEHCYMNNAKPIDTPIEKGFPLTLNHCPKNEEKNNQMSKVLYVSSIGSLMYAI